MNWWVVGLGGAAALVVALVAFLVDRDSAKRRQDILAAAPDEPALKDVGTPEYLTPEMITAQPADRGLNNQERTSIEQDLPNATVIQAGWASADFMTDQTSGWAVLDRPTVLLAESVSSVQALYSVIEQIKTAGTSLVVVTPLVETMVVVTLALNALSGKLPCLVIRTESVQEIVAATGGRVVSATDLQADYLPEASLGRAERWVASENRSWIWSAPPS